MISAGRNRLLIYIKARNIKPETTAASMPSHRLRKHQDQIVAARDW